MGGGDASRVSVIPVGVRKTIQDIKEIARNHSDEEVYAMLKDCCMDPNDTVQKLLLQDTFHEVKRKRDKKKEIIREPVDSRWRPGMLGRGGRGGRGMHSSRYIPSGAGGGRNANAGKENGVNQATEKGNTTSSSTNTPDGENKSLISKSSFVATLANGSTKVDHQSASQGSISQESGASGTTSAEESSPTEADKPGTPQSIPVDVKSGPEFGKSVLISVQLPSITSGVYGSASDPVLVPSLDARIPGAVGTNRREVGSQRVVVVESTVNKGVPGLDKSSVSVKGSTDIKNPNLHSKKLSKSPEFGASQLSDASHAISSSVTGSTGSRPSSNYSNRPQQLSSSQRAGPSKKWKPKSHQVKPAQAFGTLGTSESEPSTVEAVACSHPASSSKDSEGTPMKSEKKLEELHFLDTQHVIIPHHLQVPESERHGLSFGSFDSSFKLTFGFENGIACDTCSTTPSESSLEIEETIEDFSSSAHNASPTTQEVDYSDQRQLATQISENLPSKEADMSSGLSGVPEYDQPKPDTTPTSEGLQYSVVQTASTYPTFGLVPPILGNQFPAFESSEPQSCDAAHVPGFMVQQAFDPSSSFYTQMNQIYRPTGDSGRFSPFLAPNAIKYNGNVADLPSQAGQPPQEAGTSLVLSSAGPTTLTTQASAVMPSSIPVTQQQLPVFRPPAGVPLPHYANYLPYAPYYPQFYVTPPPLHHFINNGAFPQQSPAGIYPSNAAATAASHVKYPIPQYKPGTNAGNPNHIAIPAAYAAYSLAPTGYSPSPTATNGNSAGNEDLPVSQYRETSQYVAGQQSDGSTVWMPGSGREISNMQPNSFYNLPPHFAPTQATHGAFPPGMYHPTQPVAAGAVHPLLQQSQPMAGAVEMAGSTAGMYQQPQRAQMNWANNY